jgi:hypothetical protein
VFGRDQITYPAQVHMTVSNQMADRMVRETGWTALGPHTFYTRDEVLESVSVRSSCLVCGTLVKYVFLPKTRCFVKAALRILSLLSVCAKPVFLRDCVCCSCLSGGGEVGSAWASIRRRDAFACTFFDEIHVYQSVLHQAGFLNRLATSGLSFSSHSANTKP